MDTTLLFDFSFVDRSNESKVFDSFINENKKIYYGLMEIMV